MPRTVQKDLSFPLAGVSRLGGYREQTRPFSAPWAVNVRGVCSIERRGRGGSRPGLVKVVDDDFGSAALSGVFALSSVDYSGQRHDDLIVIADGNLNILRDGAVELRSPELTVGTDVLTIDGKSIMFGNAVTEAGCVCAKGKLLIADAYLDVLREFDPNTGAVSDVVASSGTVPTGCPLLAYYSDRLIASGASHVWYASRQGDYTDWNYGGDAGDAGRAVAGQCSLAGQIGETVTAIIPHADSFLAFASRNSLWVLRGDPASGQLVQVSSEVGISSPTAWAKAPDGLVVFLSNDGLYMWGIGSGTHPTRFSEQRIPGELRNIDPEENKITMAYDARGRGFHLFVTPAAGQGSHWWIDPENKALWPVLFGEPEHQPVAVSRMQGDLGSLSDVILACRDGYLRKFSDDATDDDGTPIESHVLLGPVPLAAGDSRDAMLAEIHGVLADSSDAVTWSVLMGTSAEAVADAAVDAVEDALAGNPATVACAGTWGEGRSKVVRTRARGSWVVVWLASSARWAYESVSIVVNQLGRLR